VAAHPNTRRRFLHVTALTGTGLLVAGIAPNEPAAGQEPKDTAKAKDADQEKDKEKSSPAEEVSPPEDLMREHGVLKRVMLVYDEIVRRIEARQDFPPDALADAAQIIRSFVEDYHEKLEENYLFPRFQKANKLVDLVTVLKVQHEAGRNVTDVILQRANASALKESDSRTAVATAIRAFNRMYAPHEAREDTELFPAFHGIVSANEYDSLGEDFEKKENELFGQDGFEKMVDRVAGIEKRLGIYDLAQFTPKL
jgi:hemerythrin-like domain-containing protein